MSTDAVGWTLRSAGGCEGVTGSAHLLACESGRVLVDAGAFQGPDEESANAAPWPFEARGIDGVVLSDGHHDHVGRLPALVAGGATGLPTFKAVDLALSPWLLGVLILATAAEWFIRRRSELK